MNTKAKTTQIRLSLARASDGYRPLFLYDGDIALELTDIHFFTPEGIKFSTGHGWFDIVKKDGPVEGERHWRQSLDCPSLDFNMVCERKRKADFDSKEPFYIPRKRPEYKSKGRFVELFLPFSRFKWVCRDDFMVSQHEETQTVYALWGIEELGVGLKVAAGQRQVTKEQREEEEFAALIAGTDPELRAIYIAYRDKIKEEKRLEKEVEDAKARLEKFGRASWIGDLLRPIGQAMLKRPELVGREVEVSGPFGIGARTSLCFYKKGVDKSSHDAYMDAYWIEFDPGDIYVGELRLVDVNTDSKDFKPGTIGEMNGLNHPLVEMPKTIEALVKWATH